MKIKLFLMVAIFLMICSHVLAEDKITLTTYYPSPFGAYDRMRLVPRESLGTPCDLGLMYFDKVKKQLMICQEDSSGNSYWGTMGVWVQEGDNIYPAAGEAPNVGIGTTFPQDKLHVANGNALFGGDVEVGIEQGFNAYYDPNYGGNGYFHNFVGIGTPPVHRVRLDISDMVGSPGTVGIRVNGATYGIQSNAVYLGVDAQGWQCGVQAIAESPIGWGVVASGPQIGVIGYGNIGVEGVGGDGVTSGVGIRGQGLIAGDFIGAVQMSSSLIVGAAGTTTGNLAVNGSGTITNDLTVNGTLSAANLTFNDLTVANRVTTKYLDVGKSANIPWIDGPLTINKDLIVNEGVQISSTLLVMGAAKAESFTETSSRDYKKDITPLGAGEALDALHNLSPVTFVFKSDDSEHHVGFIAEDVPDLVATKDRKTLSAMDIVAVLTKVVQDQQDEIEKLRSDLERLEKR